MKTKFLFIISALILSGCAEIIAEIEAYQTPPIVYGCMDQTACNYDSKTTDNDGSCFYMEDKDWCDCSGNAIDCDGVCGGENLFDFCGVCGGDNFCNGIEKITPSGDSYCLGSEVDFGGSDIDECGVCDGNGTTCYQYGSRWVDFEELNNLISFSIDREEIKYNHILEYIGDPEYIELINHESKDYILMWYQYKSKFYPTDKINYSIIKNPLDEEDLQVSKQIIPLKPPKSGEHDEWATVTDYLLVVYSNNDFEVFFVPFDNIRDPQFLKEYIFEIAD